MISGQFFRALAAAVATAVCQPRLASYRTDVPGASCVWGFVGASIKDDTGVEIKLEIKQDNTANELKKNGTTTAISHVLTHRLPGTIQAQ